MLPLAVAAGREAVVCISQLTETLMAESEYLAGKVVKWSLPVISGRPGADAPTLKRLFLPQGELAQVHDSEEGIHYMAVIETRIGAATVGTITTRSKQSGFICCKVSYWCLPKTFRPTSAPPCGCKRETCFSLKPALPTYCGLLSRGRGLSSRGLVLTRPTFSLSLWFRGQRKRRSQRILRPL